MSGDLRPDDVTKLFAGLRSSTYGRASFRELADFAAHPDFRNRGPITDRIRDMRTTFKPLIDHALNPNGASIEQIFDRAESNFRMATDEQVARLSGGLKRRKAGSVLGSAIDKLRQGPKGIHLSPAEKLLAHNFGDRLIWNPALRAKGVFDDFKQVMLKNGLMTACNSDKLDDARALVILHAITVMHGVAFDIGDGMKGVLQAGYKNEEGCLEVTTVLNLEGYPKMISLKLGMFWTDLLAKNHVDEMLLDRHGPWDFPIEIQDNKLCPIGDVPELQEEDDNSTMVHLP
ncbi:hypothetical protein [Kordiimonas lipolytica]|nr:hypothetical protein [Kordiimonas lipolytica]